MTTEREIFAAAAALPAAERPAYLDAACGGNAEVRARVEDWLRTHDADSFMEAGACAPEIEANLARLKPEEVGERIGPYKLMEQIGQGGFGTVWVADQERPVRRRVVLKIIKMGMDTKEVIARFEQERQALAMMDHPHIAKVLDAGATQWGRPFFVMELVRGIKITDYCDQANLPTAERLALFIQVCNAVQHAHQKGIIHRDLKPSNILVTLHDGVPVPKVIDFGVAKATQQQRLTDLTIYTQFQQMIGTPLYMSPEQAEMSGLDIDTRSDIYSLGVLLYELLTGRTPFDPEELMRQGLDEIRRTIREQEPQKPSTFLSTMAFELRTNVAQHRQVEGAKLVGLIRGDLDWIVMKALEKDRTRRYETTTDFARDLQRFLEDKPVSAAAPSASYRFSKFARRNKAGLGVAALIFAILVAATGVSVWQAKVALAAKKDALAKATAERLAREEAEAISTFLTEVFQSTDPERSGRTASVAETLERAVRKLDSLGNHPARQLTLQATLGWTFHKQGLDREAIPLLEKVRDRCLKALGPDHSETMRAVQNLAHAYLVVHREEAIGMQEQVLDFFRRVSGPEHPDTLGAMIDLWRSFTIANRKEEALELWTAVMRILHSKNAGPEYRHTLLALAEVGLSYAYGDQAPDALKVWEEVLTLSRKLNGPEHPDTLSAMSSLAFSYRAASRPGDALRLREDALMLCRKIYGPEHQNTLWFASEVANSYFEADRREEALKLREEVAALSRKTRGADHLVTLLAVADLADSHFRESHMEEALKLREEVVALARQTLRADNYDTLRFVNALALSYERAGRLEEALPLLADALTHRAKDMVPAQKITALQVWFGKYAEHAATCQRVLKLSSDTADPSVADRAAKAYCLLPSSDPALLDAALTLAQRAVELGKKHKYLAYFQMALGMAEYRKGNYTEADATLAAATQGGQHFPHVREPARFFRAMSLFQQGKAAEASTLFAEAEAQMKSLPADDRQPLANGASPDDLIVWLAYKEAKTLLRSPR